jgi:photosystem II stability/assembly factor-like uncharacterized protein
MLIPSRTPRAARCRIALAAALVFVAVAGRARADRLTAAEVRQNLLDACAVRDGEVWMVGDLGRLFHTTDGGKTWDRRPTPSGLSFVALACPTRADLWAAGQAGEILHSSDGGATWVVQQSGTKRQLLGIAFATAQRGVAVGDFGTLLRTDDGGATWSAVGFPPDVMLPPEAAEVVDPGDVVLYGVTFADPEHAWVVGEFGVILASSDGGRTWHQQASSVEASLFGVSFADARRGWAVGLDATLLSTGDGGRHWERRSVDPPKGFMLALYDVEVRGQNGWAVGNNGFLLHSADGGQSWQTVQVPVEMSGTWFRGVALRPDGRGRIVGARGLMLAVDGARFTPSKDRL